MSRWRGVLWPGFGEPAANPSKPLPTSDLVLPDTPPRSLSLSSEKRSRVTFRDNMRRFYLLSYPHVVVHDRQPFSTGSTPWWLGG